MARAHGPEVAVFAAFQPGFGTMKGNLTKAALIVGGGVLTAAGMWLFQRWVLPVFPARIR